MEKKKKKTNSMKEKNYLMIHDYILHKVLDGIKEIISTEKLDDTKLLIDTNDKLPDDITLINVMILMTCVIQYDGKLHR